MLSTVLIQQHMDQLQVDLHTHSPDKYNVGRDSQLMESKAHGSSESPERTDGKTQCLTAGQLQSFASWSS